MTCQTSQSPRWRTRPTLETARPLRIVKRERKRHGRRTRGQHDGGHNPARHRWIVRRAAVSRRERLTLHCTEHERLGRRQSVSKADGRSFIWLRVLLCITCVLYMIVRNRQRCQHDPCGTCCSSILSLSLSLCVRVRKRLVPTRVHSSRTCGTVGCVDHAWCSSPVATARHIRGGKEEEAAEEA